MLPSTSAVVIPGLCPLPLSFFHFAVTSSNARDISLSLSTTKAKYIPSSDIANTVCDFIQVEIDCPSMHQDGLMPILDLALKMQENYVTYQYYRKSMANFKVLMAESAMPRKMKRICLTQEVVRILRNTSKILRRKLEHITSVSSALEWKTVDIQHGLGSKCLKVEWQHMRDSSKETKQVSDHFTGPKDTKKLKGIERRKYKK